MEFKAQPGVIDIEFFLKLVDNALADITERSNIIGKYFDINLSHASLLLLFEHNFCMGFRYFEPGGLD